MMKKIGIIKRRIAICLIFLMCINSFGAVVSDNDGSAFITKAEFDSLKNNFQSQIDNYNQSIDSKIDGAIAAYLSGVRFTVTSTLKLPQERGYKFPLRYDTSENWNNVNSPWFTPIRPELHRKDFRSFFFSCGEANNTGKQKNWPVVYNYGDHPVDLKVASVSGATPLRWPWAAADMLEFELNVEKRLTEGFGVVKTSETRDVDTHTGAVIYKVNTFGKGYAILNYSPDATYGNISNNVGHVSTGTAYDENFVMYPYTFGYGYNFLVNSSKQMRYPETITASDPLWQPKYLKWKGGGNTRWPTESPDKPPFTQRKLKEIGNAVKSARGDSTTVMIDFLNESTTSIDNQSVSWETTGEMQRIYGRGANCPIIGPNFNLEFVAQPNSTTEWWDQVYSYTGPVGGSIVSSQDMPRVMLIVQCQFGFMPNNKVHANTTFDASDSDNYSMLPSSLLQYTSSEGDVHYIDEGMWLGKISSKGTVEFTVRFGKDAGTGTKVKLHVSKRPFDYNYSDSQLLSISCNGSAGTEPTLDYGTSYRIKIDNVAANEDLYLEWLPVDTSDLPYLESFEDFTHISDD